MKKKMRNSKGFTVVEVLIATALLAIFVSMAIVGTSALFGTGEKMMTVAKAAVLGSDVMKIVTNEVRFGDNFSLNGKTITYNSTSYGEGCEITIEDNGQLAIKQTSKITSNTGEEITNSKTFFPIGSAAYDEVFIKSIDFNIEKSTASEERQVITCTLSITDGENTLWEKTLSLVPLYQKSIA